MKQIILSILLFITFSFTHSNFVNQCVSGTDPNEQICSGRGICFNGTCECNLRQNPDEMFYGKYCEFDNFSCARYSAKICAGHGKCDTGTCICEPGWAGFACECATSVKTCKNEESDICSGHGICICGVCKCEEGWSGVTCSNELK